MRQLKYRRRQDAKLARVWVGRQRTRVLRALAEARHPQTATALAQRSRTSYGVASSLLAHLEAAGWVNVQEGLVENSGRPGDQWASYYWLTDHGQVQLAVLLAPAA